MKNKTMNITQIYNDDDDGRIWWNKKILTNSGFNSICRCVCVTDENCWFFFRFFLSLWYLSGVYRFFFFCHSTVSISIISKERKKKKKLEMEHFTMVMGSRGWVVGWYQMYQNQPPPHTPCNEQTDSIVKNFFLCWFNFWNEWMNGKKWKWFIWNSFIHLFFFSCLHYR